MRRAFWVLLVCYQAVLAVRDEDQLEDHILPNGETCLSLPYTSSCVTVSSSLGDWSSSVHSCEASGQAPPVVSDGVRQELLVEVMKRQGLDNVWLPAKMSRNNWFWIGQDEKDMGSYNKWGPGRPFPREISDVADCVMAITYRDFRWEDKACAFVTGFVCEAEVGSKLCEEPSPFDEVVFSDSRCLLVSNQRLSFFKARDFCHQLDTRLVRVEDEGTQRALERITSWNISFVGSYWIGLTRVKWRWHDGIEVGLSFWEASQPSRSNADCVRIERFSSEDYLWANSGCDQLSHYVCITDKPVTTTEAEMTSTTTSVPIFIFPTITRSTTQQTTTIPTTSVQPSSTETPTTSSTSQPSPSSTITTTTISSTTLFLSTRRKRIRPTKEPPVVTLKSDGGGISESMLVIAIVLSLAGLLSIGLIICCILFIRRVRSRRRELRSMYQTGGEPKRGFPPSTVSQPSPTSTMDSQGTVSKKRRYIKNQNSNKLRTPMPANHYNKSQIYHDDDEDDVNEFETPVCNEYPVGYCWHNPELDFEPVFDLHPEPNTEVIHNVDVLAENPDYLNYVSRTPTPSGSTRKILHNMLHGSHSESKGKEARHPLTPSTFVNDGFNNNNSLDHGRDEAMVEGSVTGEQAEEDLSVVSYSPSLNADNIKEAKVEKEPSMREKYTSLRNAMKQQGKGRGSVGRASVLSAPGNIEGEMGNNGRNLPWLGGGHYSRHEAQDGRRGSYGGTPGVVGMDSRNNFIWAVPYPGDYIDLGSAWLPDGPVTEL